MTDRRRRRPVGNVTPLRDWLSTGELAYWLSFSTRTLERWRAAGTGPPWFKVGRHVRYDLAAVDRWIDAHTVPELPPPGWPRRRLLHLAPPAEPDLGTGEEGAGQ